MSRFKRKQSTREPKAVIHIFTEGEKTEPDYFNAIKNELRANEIDIKVIGLGDHTDSLVKWVIERKNDISKTDEESEWWVVFDLSLICLLYTSPSPRDRTRSRMPSSA